MQEFKQRLLGTMGPQRTDATGALHVQMEGNKLLAALGHKGVIELGANSVRLRLGRGGELVINGQELVIEHISREAAIVCGAIEQVFFANMPKEAQGKS